MVAPVGKRSEQYHDSSWIAMAPIRMVEGVGQGKRCLSLALRKGFLQPHHSFGLGGLVGAGRENASQRKRRIHVARLGGTPQGCYRLVAPSCLGEESAQFGGGLHVTAIRQPGQETNGALGVRLSPSDDPVLIVNDLDKLALIAVEFPAFTDGRGYSTATLLRERYGYKGELRAIGEVARDHLHAMAQCGFDSFLLREGEDAQAALAAFDDFSEQYQATVARPSPLFRRRAG